MIGKILGDRYEIIELIGEGGMARVYKAKCNLLNRYVAVKILRDEFTGDEEFVKRFRRESQAAASLSHPSILNIYDVGEEVVDGKDIHYIVMEYIDGKTLKDIINEKGKFSVDESIEYSIQIAEALKNAHENHIIHRDIKPQNIMVTGDNRVKVTDFGIARAATSATVTITADALGSVHYLSPEQARGGYTDEKSDIYSLGIVMYEMTTGRLPYVGDSAISVALKHVQEDMVRPRELNPNIPTGLETIILRCVAKQQSDRYDSVAQVIEDLKKVRKGEQVSRKDKDVEEDEFATQVIPIVDEGNYAERAEKSKNKKGTNKKAKKEKKEPGGFKVTVMAILLAFIVVTAGFFGISKLKGLFSGKGEVVVPNLLGMVEEQAELEVEKVGLKLKVTGTTKNEEYGPGEVVNQSEPEGAKVKEGFTIEVVLNEMEEEEELIRVPGVISKTLEEAETILRELGLEPGEVKTRPSDATPEGIVLTQEPEAYAFVEKGSKVNLVVSEGEESPKIKMPRVTGLGVDEAKQTLANLGLRVEVSEEYSNDFEENTIMWQSFKEGVDLEEGATVGIYVSKGPKPGEDTGGTTENSGNSETENQKETSYNINVTPFTDRDSTEIRIIRRQDGQSEEVYRKSHGANEGEVSISVRGKKGAEFEVLFDDIYQFTRRKDN